jgi:hypothetical protein
MTAETEATVARPAASARRRTLPHRGHERSGTITRRAATGNCLYRSWNSRAVRVWWRTYDGSTDEPGLRGWRDGRRPFT